MNQPQQIQIDSVARDDLTETFADSFSEIKFDGQSWRFEFCVIRMDQPKPPKTVHGKRVPVCRLVLTPQAGFDLASKLTVLMSEMEKQGMIKKTATTPMPPTSSKPN